MKRAILLCAILGATVLLMSELKAQTLLNFPGQGDSYDFTDPISCYHDGYVYLSLSGPQILEKLVAPYPRYGRFQSQSSYVFKIDTSGAIVHILQLDSVLVNDIKASQYGVVLSGQQFYPSTVDTTIAGTIFYKTNAYVGVYDLALNLQHSFVNSLTAGHTAKAISAQHNSLGDVIAIGSSIRKARYNSTCYLFKLDAQGSVSMSQQLANAKTPLGIAELNGTIALLYRDLSGVPTLELVDQNGANISTATGFAAIDTPVKAAHFGTYAQGFILPNGDVTNASGQVQWSAPGQMLIEADNGRFFGFYTDTTSSITPNTADTVRAAISKYDANGNELWRKHYAETVTKTLARQIMNAGNGTCIALARQLSIYPPFPSPQDLSNNYLLLNLDSSGVTTHTPDTLRAIDNAYTRTGFNNVSAMLSTSGLLFSELPLNGVTDPMLKGFKVPATSPKELGTIFGSGWWIGAKDANDELHLKAVKYNEAGVEFVAGPRGLPYAEHRKWDHIWYVTKAEVDALKADFNDNGVLDDPIPASILSWPAKGSTTATGRDGAPITVAQDAAPFEDVNLNGIYDPQGGDYPVIQGDAMYWFVYNDDIVGESHGKPLGMDFHVSAFGYSDPADTALYHTVFINLKYVNRSANDYSDVYLGNFVDLDLGCFNNDYVGCDTTRDMFYAYNGTTTDPDCATRGYGVSPPVQTVRFIDMPMSTFAYWNNDFTVTGNPYVAADHYNYMQGLWIDSTCITSDVGNGYGGSACSKYLYPSEPGGPAYPASWSEVSVNNTPADRRGLGASGPHSLPANGSISITAAYTFHANNDTILVPNMQQIGAESDSVVAHYLRNYVPVGIEELSNNNITATIYPNPSSGLFTLSVSELKGKLNVQVYNLLGEQVMSVKRVSATNTQLDLSHLQDGIYLVKVGGQVLRLVKHQ